MTKGEKMSVISLLKMSVLWINAILWHFHWMFYIVKVTDSCLNFPTLWFSCLILIYQSKKNIFLSTCPLDKHYIKFGCPKSKSSCPKFCQVPKQSGAYRNKWNGLSTAKLKVMFTCSYFVKYEDCFCFNFLTKNVLVPRTSHVKAKFLPVLYNRTEVLAHPADY